jgi:anti-sigma B factor antagonist
MRSAGLEPRSLVHSSAVVETVVRLAGEIDVSTVGQARAQLGDAIVDNPGAVITVDMGEVVFLDSTGIGAIVSALKRARHGDGDLRLVGVQPQVFKVFQLTGLTRALEIEAAD